MPWDAPDWLDGATAWIDSHVERTGDVEIERLRVWSAIARVPTADGLLWFKESAPSLVFESALTAFVAARRPGQAATVLAAEGARFLTADDGPRLRDVLEADGTPTWETIVSSYAELQLALSGEVEAMLALGAPDSRPAALAERFGDPQLVDDLGDVVPISLIHEEVHDGNVHVRDGRPVFIDWAEASVSHPFAGIVNTLRFAGPESALRLRDAYLEHWTSYAPATELRRIFAHAFALGCLCRAATWSRLLDPFPEGSFAREEYGDFPAVWLEMFAEARANPDRLETWVTPPIGWG